jgi:hypothetical protein
MWAVAVACGPVAWLGLLKDHPSKYKNDHEGDPRASPELSVGLGRVLDVIVIEDVFTAPQDFLGNAVFAHTMIGHFQAVQLEQLAAYADATEGDEFAHLEVAALLHISDRAAQHRLRFALTLTERLPHTVAALKQGWIGRVARGDRTPGLPQIPA